MEYETKAIVIDRKKDKENPGKEMPYNVEVKLFSVNNPHLTDEVPTVSLEFENKQKVTLKNFEVSFFPMGADIIVNNVQRIKVTEKQDEVIVENIGSVV